MLQFSFWHHGNCISGWTHGVQGFMAKPLHLLDWQCCGYRQVPSSLFIYYYFLDILIKVDSSLALLLGVWQLRKECCCSLQGGFLVQSPSCRKSFSSLCLTKGNGCVMCHPAADLVHPWNRIVLCRLKTYLHVRCKYPCISIYLYTDIWMHEHNNHNKESIK